MVPRDDILDEQIDRLELRVRTLEALTKRFGESTLVREVVMLSTDDVTELLRPYHYRPSIFVRDIQDSLEKYRLSLAMSWSELPPSRYAIVRNPARMRAYVPT